MSERPEPCTTFAWMGQSFKYCDDCSLPYWVHENEYRLGGTQPINEVSRAACKAKWGDS